MSTWIFLKVFGDLCIYFSVIGAFPSLFTHEFTFFWPVLLCAAGAGMATLLFDYEKPKLRFLTLILPLSSFILTGSLIELLMLVLPLVYTTVVIVRGRLSLEYYSFRQTYLRSFIPWGLFFVVIYLFQYFEEVFNPDQTLLDCGITFRFGLLYAFTGVLLLRQLRIGLDDRAQQRMNRRQMISTLCCSGAGLLGIVALERLLHDSATSILKLVYGFIGLVLSLPYKLLLMLIESESDRIVDFTETVHPSQSPEPTVTVPMETPPVEHVTQTVTESGFPWWLVVLILIALLVGMFFLLRTFRRRGISVGSEETVDRIAPLKREKQPSRQSNRGKVRHIYRQFLKEEQKKGMRRKISHTSADVLRSISPTTDPQAAADLREVYLRARYDVHSDITPQQVDAAKNALRRSRKS